MTNKTIKIGKLTEELSKKMLTEENDKSKDKNKSEGKNKDRSEGEDKNKDATIEIPDFGKMEGDGDFSKNQLISAKGWVFEQEKNNYDKIYCFRTPTNSAIKWWKIGGHSVLFLCSDIYPMLGIEKVPRIDRDGYYDFKEGVVSERSVEALREKLYRVGIDMIAESDIICIFQLRKIYLPKDVREYWKDMGAYKARALDVIGAKYKFPDLEDLMRQFMKITYNKFRKANDGGYLVKDYAITARKGYARLRYVCIGFVDIQKGLQEVLGAVNYLGENLYILAELEIWDRKTIDKLAELIIKIRKETLEAIAKYVNGKAN